MSARPQKGKKTFSNQDSLPPLPVPTLDETCTKYLRSVRPLLTDEEYKRTEIIVQRFQEPGGIGQSLQEKLLAKSKQERNWMERWWEDLVYLSPREPNAVFVNYYAAGCEDLPVLGSYSQANAAAAVMLRYIIFKEKIEREELPPETMGGIPLCMNQFTRMFNEARIPGEFIDEIKTFPGAKHVVVLRHNQMFAFDVYHPNGKRYSPAEMELQLEKVIKIQGDQPITDPPISMLTGGDRTNWAKAREALLELDPTNKESIDLIDSSLFVVVLDDASPSGRSEVSRAALCGDGYNRWFDKSMQVIAFKNGVTCCNGEHSYADAMVCVTLGVYVADDITSSKGTHRFDAATIEQLPEPRKLEWKVNDVILKHIEEAKTTLLKNIANLNIHVIRYLKYGKQFCKEAKVHPDVLVQLGLQLAYFRLHGEPCGTYETGHTRMFYHGRTETIRSCTIESLAWTKAMMNPNSTTEDKLKLFDGAVGQHQKYSEMAITARGVDRHLLGLRIIAAQEGMTDLAIFTDKGYQKSTTFTLSTSNVGYTSMWGGFAPVVEDGYGCCYTIQTNTITVSITSYKSCGSTSPTLFASALERSFDDIQSLLSTRIAKL
eukprot:TRINITY_DN9060_c0_g1_i2.p1 TRINITY_DN9060_c0_g1~~TRINITY_DN9060_c0_g1_i2.p1  ORF type:complete len:602 (-),score=147.00 TRINITY_DN9060_c0_g1_i2:99-1904(-)